LKIAAGKKKTEKIHLARRGGRYTKEGVRWSSQIRMGGLRRAIGVKKKGEEPIKKILGKGEG